MTEQPGGRSLDIFFDLTTSDIAPSPERFTARARRITCVVRPDAPQLSGALPAHWAILHQDSAVAACTDAMRRAAADAVSLLVLHGPVEASEEALHVMQQCLDQDPMFGCAAARIRCADGCCVRRPARNGLEPGLWIPRRTLADVAEREVCPELFEAALLLRAEIAAEFGELDPRFAVLPAAVLNYLSRARRSGYRVVLANRAVMPVRGLTCADGQPDSPPFPQRDLALLRNLTPELDRSWAEFRCASNERFEELNAHAYRSSDGTGQRAVLLDIRNVEGVHNGTSQVVLGSVEALHRLAPRWDVTVLAQPTGIQFHGLRKAWKHWDLTTTVPRSPFAAALRLSQPWHVQEMVDLHHAALFNVYFMLDTIAWDTVYASPPRLDGTWSFLADHADGFLFDSAFTERRFLARFGEAASAPRAVCHYPFNPGEYRNTATQNGEVSDYILVVGNELDHKDTIRTISLLSAAFPFRPLVVLGPKIDEAPFLRAYRAGAASAKQVASLYARASIVIFPSFYEGFGLPTVTALAYGKTVIARKSELLDEIAARCSSGRLIAFSRRDELVAIVGRLLHGGEVRQESLGTESSDTARRWSDVAQDMVAFVDNLVRQPSRARWLRREHAINQLLALAGGRIGC